MGAAEIIALFNILFPHVVSVIRGIQDSNPNMSYKETLELAGVRLDAEYARLLADMAQAVKDGAVPRGGGTQ